MATRPAELLRFAKRLECNDEASCRAAISCAYYCAFHAVMPVVEKLPATPGYALSGHIRHEQVADRLKRWDVPTRWSKASKNAGDQLAVAREYRAAMSLRKTANYLMDGDLLPEDVKWQLDRVAKIQAFIVRFMRALPRDFPSDNANAA